MVRLNGADVQQFDVDCVERDNSSGQYSRTDHDRDSACAHCAQRLQCRVAHVGEAETRDHNSVEVSVLKKQLNGPTNGFGSVSSLADSDQILTGAEVPSAINQCR